MIRITFYPLASAIIISLNPGLMIHQLQPEQGQLQLHQVELKDQVPQEIQFLQQLVPLLVEWHLSKPKEEIGVDSCQNHP